MDSNSEFCSYFITILYSEWTVMMWETLKVSEYVLVLLYMCTCIWGCSYTTSWKGGVGWTTASVRRWRVGSTCPTSSTDRFWSKCPGALWGISINVFQFLSFRSYFPSVHCEVIFLGRISPPLSKCPVNSYADWPMTNFKSQNGSIKGEIS